MNISKLFYFFVYLLFINAIVPCLSMNAEAPEKGPSSGNIRVESSRTTSRFEIEAPYKTVERIHKKIADRILKGFNTSTAEEKVELIQRTDGLKATIQEMLNREDKISRDQEKYIKASVLYKVLNAALEFMTYEDEKRKETVKNVFDMKNYHDQLREQNWKEVLDEMKEVFRNGKIIENMTNNEKENLWARWYEIIMKRKIDYLTSDTNSFLNMLDNKDEESLFLLHYNSSVVSWKNYKLYLMKLMEDFLKDAYISWYRGES